MAANGDANAVESGLMLIVGLLALYVALMGRLGSLLASIIDPASLISSNPNGGTSSFNTPTNTGTNTGSVTPLSNLVPSFQQGSYRAMAVADAQRYGINPNLFIKQIEMESGFQSGVVSPAGAVGIAQFVPSTAAGLGVNPWDPVSSLAGAAALDARNLKAYGGDYQKMLAAYNAGAGTVNAAIQRGGANWLSYMPAETQNYVRSIIG